MKSNRLDICSQIRWTRQIDGWIDGWIYGWMDGYRYIDRGIDKVEYKQMIVRLDR